MHGASGDQEEQTDGGNQQSEDDERLAYRGHSDPVGGRCVAFLLAVDAAAVLLTIKTKFF